MSPTILLLTGFGVILLILLTWFLRDPGKTGKPLAELVSAEDSDRRHVTYFSQVQQALAAEDFVFLASRGSLELTRRVRKERRRIALAYLFCLRSEFLKLWRVARVIASLSPKVGVTQELVRFRVGVGFTLRFEMIRLKLLLGLAPLPELGSLSDFISRLAIRLETAMKDLGERAALAGELASTLDRRGLDAS